MVDGLITFAAVRDESGRIVDFRCTWANHAGSWPYGTEPDPIGKTIDEVWPGCGQPAVIARLVRVVESGERLVRVLPAVPDPHTEDDEQHWVESRAAPFRDGVLVASHDISPRARARPRLEAVQERLLRLLEVSDATVGVTDRDGNIEYINTAAQKLFGTAAEDAIGRPTTEKILPQLRRGREQVAQRMRDNPVGTHRYQVSVIQPDGSEVELLVAASAIQDEQGNFDGRISIGIDVTPLKRAQAELAESERRFRLLAENSTDVVRVMDGAGRHTYVSPSAKDVLGYTPEELLGRRWSEFLEEDDAADNRRMLANLAALPELFSTEYRFRRRDGLTIWVQSRIRQIRDAVSGELIELQASTRDVTEKVLAVRQLEESEARFRARAVHDPLTGLPNRQLLFDRLEHALAAASRSGTAVAVLFVDIDNFKFINDSLGHDAGDQVLVAVGERLATAARQGDTVARFGGDEYVVICESIRDRAQAQAAAERLLERVQGGLVADGHRVHVTVSVGVALSDGRRARAADLLRNADVAMYHAKQRGRDRYEIFDAGLSAGVTRRLRTETELRDGLGAGELVVYYQPIVALGTGELVGLEALVRWAHPRRGLLAPAQFIDVAEDTGLIARVGREVLAQACADGAGWLAEHAGRPLFIAVNVSLRQLAWGDFAEVLDTVLADTGFDPGRLHLELTETALLDAHAAKTDLTAIAERGVAIGIDDFGTGYSSLSYLKRFPVRFLKVDKSFVDGLGHDAGDTAIVEAIVRLGQTLSLDVIAEGAETAGQLQLLRALGATAAQGYAISPPQPFDRIAAAAAYWTG